MARVAARFGIVFLPETLTGWGDLCREAEETGFEWLGVADSQSVFRELYVALTLAALHTRRVRLGPLVTNPLTRHLVVEPAQRRQGFALGTETDALVIGQLVRQRGDFEVFGLDGRVFGLDDVGIPRRLLEESPKHRRHLSFSGRFQV